MSRIIHTLTVLSLAAAFGCTPAAQPAGEGAGGDGDLPVTQPADTTGPVLVSSVPAQGATGVHADTQVVLTFSEPMDPGTFVEALDTSTLGAVYTDWNDDYTVLTLTPGQPLEYAEGDGDPAETEALSYRVSLDTSARDQDGNPLDVEHDIRFTTYKAMHGAVGPIHELTRVMTPSELLFQDTDPLVVGDDSADIALRTSLSFDLTGIPADADRITGAVITTRQMVGDTWGTPYTDLGVLVLDHVAFDGLDDSGAVNAAFNTSQVAFDSYVGFASSLEDVSIAFDVTDAVDADLADRAASLDRSQFLLYFDGYTDLNGDDDRAVFDRNALQLEVDYLVP